MGFELMATSNSVVETEASRQTGVDEGTVFAVLAALSVSHMLNDIMQSLIPAVYPLLKEQYHLTFTQVGLITFTFQLTASLLQPIVGLSTDRKPRPYSLATGMVFTFVGLILLSMAHHFVLILIAAGLVAFGAFGFVEAWYRPIRPEAAAMKA